MNKYTGITLALFILSLQAESQSQYPGVVSGKLERIESFQSQYVSSRNIDIWLPEGYSDTTEYSVLYMHDGQMLFDPGNTWNKQAWDVDDVASALFRTGMISEFIVVGIWNGGYTRHSDYFPQKPLELLSQTERDTVTAQLQRAGRTEGVFEACSDNYLKFIVKEVRPIIDDAYSVYTGKEHTFIAGSSMGGLISLYAICEYPDIFGGAACMSTHWVGTFSPGNNPVPDAFIDYLSKNLPDPRDHKIYFDYGDQTLDSLYPPIQERVDSLMVLRGYSSNNWITRYFPGDDHSERSWNRRLDIPLEFMFKK